MYFVWFKLKNKLDVWYKIPTLFGTADGANTQARTLRDVGYLVQVLPPGEEPERQHALQES